MVGALVGAGALAGSCGVEVKPAQGASPVVGARSSVFAPVTLRIHPLTRFFPPGETPDGRIELYLELLDRWNDPTKALGDFVVELYAPGDGGSERQVQRWNIPLRDPDENAGVFDRVTRSYHLTLADVPGEVRSDRQLAVRVRFTSAGGAVLVAAHALDG